VKTEGPPSIQSCQLLAHLNQLSFIAYMYKTINAIVSTYMSILYRIHARRNKRFLFYLFYLLIFHMSFFRLENVLKVNFFKKIGTVTMAF